MSFPSGARAVAATAVVCMLIYLAIRRHNRRPGGPGFRRREREAQAMTLRARLERERREGAGLSDEERTAWAEIESKFSSEGKP